MQRTVLVVRRGGREPRSGRYGIRTASLDGGPVRTSLGLTLVPDLALADAGGPALLLVPGGRGTRPEPGVDATRSSCGTRRCAPRPGHGRSRFPLT
ncbi:hypothetical protein SUDANB96_05701 [Streptomyces sp. enrichment culture]